MNLEKLTMNQLISLRNKIDGIIHSYEDGYIYICSVRCYGSVWEDRPSSLYSLRELCDSYYGDNGIVDVYTNNPNLEFPEIEFRNYGDVMFIESEQDYREWTKHNKSKRLIDDVTKQLDQWDDRDNLPFNYRPSFAPQWTREDLNEWVTEFKSKDWDFVAPRAMKKDQFEEDSED